MAEKPPQKRSYEIRVVGARRVIFGDWYHSLLRIPWSATIGVISGAVLLINAIFAVLYQHVGGVANARPDSFLDAFYFSAQTMGTIGYGAMYPQSNGANAVMVAESVVSLIVTALATGLVFAKFARPLGRVAFSRYAVVATMDGVPTLMIRVGNERGNTIVEATVHVTLTRTVRTMEGTTFYKLIDLKLTRDRSPAVARSWTILHAIEGDSPILGLTPEKCTMEDVEIMVTLAGTDDTSYQPVHARHEYEHQDILWGYRHADVLSETPDGNITLDVRRFHEVVRNQPTEAFPYPRASDGPGPAGPARPAGPVGPA
ncbi:MAG TPA: ion channel [Polyangiaceae bacterium]|jgi:inward rectifier potassium channel